MDNYVFKKALSVAVLSQDAKLKNWRVLFFESSTSTLHKFSYESCY